MVEIWSEVTFVPPLGRPPCPPPQLSADFQLARVRGAHPVVIWPCHTHRIALTSCIPLAVSFSQPRFPTRTHTIAHDSLRLTDHYYYPYPQIAMDADDLATSSVCTAASPVLLALYRTHTLSPSAIRSVRGPASRVTVRFPSEDSIHHV